MKEEEGRREEQRWETRREGEREECEPQTADSEPSPILKDILKTGRE